MISTERAIPNAQREPQNNNHWSRVSGRSTVTTACWTLLSFIPRLYIQGSLLLAEVNWVTAEGQGAIRSTRAGGLNLSRGRKRKRRRPINRVVNEAEICCPALRLRLRSPVPSRQRDVDAVEFLRPDCIRVGDRHLVAIGHRTCKRRERQPDAADQVRAELRGVGASR